MLPTPLFTPPPKLSNGGEFDKDVEVLNQNSASGLESECSSTSVMKGGKLQFSQPPLPQMLPTPLSLAPPQLPSPPDMFGVLGTF